MSRFDFVITMSTYACHNSSCYKSNLSFLSMLGSDLKRIATALLVVSRFNVGSSAQTSRAGVVAVEMHNTLLHLHKWSHILFSLMLIYQRERLPELTKNKIDEPCCRSD